MKDYKQFYGVDVSKKSVDIVYTDRKVSVHQKFTNDRAGMEELYQWLEQNKASPHDTLFCMETTGLYCFTLTNFLCSNGIDIWLEHSTTIKKATALSRGKSDKVDAYRIADYAMRNLDRIRLWKPMSVTLEKIKHLATLRERLVETTKRLTTPIREFEQVGNTAMAKFLEKSIKKTLRAIDKDIASVELQIMDIVDGDENLKNLYRIITSVVGIGFVTAINLIVHTQGFTVMNDARKLACYCGVAPFEYSSGTSIRGKTKVHPMANKKIKCNLHMASVSAVKHDAWLKAYYERKVAEGKNKMSVLNAVKAKLLGRVVSCVNNNRMYVDNFAQAA
ncbi:MAG: IS110 family transposase [Cyclobacteriaceae bacterium]|jgi:transposase|nr:IS110 family transposase [Cyclobacteriaceae bacterium]